MSEKFVEEPKQKLHSLVESCTEFSSEDKAFHLQQIETGETNEDKIKFYIEAAKKRTEIVRNAPEDKKGFVLEEINKLLNQSSHGNREQVKGKQLQSMQKSLDQFLENQKIVKEKTQRLHYLPSGVENRIWERFMKRLEEETSGNILSPVLMDKFRKSVETTFSHLTRTLELQETLKKGMANEEKYFWLHGKKSKENENDRLSKILETRLEEWLSQKRSLRDWKNEFDKLVMKQTPKGIKEFNENYTQVFTQEFWSLFPKANPMSFPNFTAEFNFKTEKDFLTEFSLSDLKKFPKKLKKAITQDEKEILGEFFSHEEKTQQLSKLKGLSEKKPKELLILLFNLKKQQEKNRNFASKDLVQAKKFYLARNPKAAESELKSLEKKFGKGVLRNLGEQNFAKILELRMMRIYELEKRLKNIKDKNERKYIQSQLDELCVGAYCNLDQKSVEDRKEKVNELMETISEKRKQGKLIEAKAAAKKLYGLDNEKAQNQIDQINKEMNKKSDKDKEKDSESDNENSEEKQKKIDFLEKSIEHAKKVMEACDQIGIPKNDPAFWGPEGVKNRVLWLKKHGLYDTYQKFNGSDPNIPKDAQTGGFRFRWMDSRGTELNGSRATDGMKYLVRYKESGYILAAIAGAFSVNWKSASSPTYTPDKYIIKVEEQLTDIKGKKVA
ncbi:hypothetical protein KAI58_05095 [Candidatus Gracilibacteria bacterium]|nr:hypothetical protein [Candidatus Gracilibacteria bacterium]